MQHLGFVLILYNDIRKKDMQINLVTFTNIVQHIFLVTIWNIIL